MNKVGMLTVVSRLPGSKYLCKCDCGNEKIVSVGHFNTGLYKTCGCQRHGHGGKGKRSREYIAYHNMIARCHKPGNKRYVDNGAKGIVVCDKWRESFKSFIADMGPCPAGFQIDRIDNSGSYRPDNCRWVSPKENAANRSVTKIWSVFGEEFKSSTDAAKSNSVSPHTIIAWCQGRTAEGRFYPPKQGCSVRPAQ
jgi:hypothetical protein